MHAKLTALLAEYQATGGADPEDRGGEAVCALLSDLIDYCALNAVGLDSELAIARERLALSGCNCKVMRMQF
jgi:uncharacterized protein YsxB (DUF464 family)